MTIIKKIDLFVFKKFVMLFAGSFFVCLFVLIMQFLWRYVDDLIGKGLSMELLGKFFWYASITLVPTAMPLAILLSALISFGNMGEDLELTAMKSAGIPLRRMMAPLCFFCLILAGISFVFQNNISPNAQKQLTRMIATMKETSPAIEIPEGVFYSGIPNVNIYVDHKNTQTGMLYKVIIYKVDQGFENAQIVVADSAQLETTADKHFLRLMIFNGEQFENLQSGSSTLLQKAQVPYDRETFKDKTLLISFDSDFNLMDADIFAGMARVKNLKELQEGADSIIHSCDSIGYEYYVALNSRYLQNGLLTKADSARAITRSTAATCKPDTIIKKLSSEKRLQAIEDAQQTVKNALTDLEFQKPVTENGYENARKHLIEWHQKFALSLSCLIFFFIGAPLGAIIRKGGLGLPTVISVVIFIIYYIINTSGMKLARDGNCEVIYGMWISSIIMAPLGFFLSYKANNDSVVFNIDAYMSSLRRFFGIKTGRLILPKEVIISPPDYTAELVLVDHLTEDCLGYIKAHKLPFAANYFKTFFKVSEKDSILQLQEEQENLIERLSNSRDLHLLNALSKYPEIYTHAHTAFHRRWLNIVSGIIFPVGIILWFRIWKYRIQLFRDLKDIEKCNAKTKIYIQKILNN
ncbi:MAG: LptF/LptG family permease [Bacteroidaceae bacterium]